jgi:SAM-dependent methyltransferase
MSDRPQTSRSAPAPPRDRWARVGAGQHYDEGRWRSERRRQRDPRLIRRALARHAPRSGGASGLVLDVPCGAGRLRPGLAVGARCWVGLDVSDSMLAAARAAGAGPLLRGDAEALPFRDGAFDVVVCCRLLHHLADDGALAGTVAELVRVGSDLVLASFWDSAALPEVWRRLRGDRRVRGRRPHTKRRIRALLDDAGADVLEFVHSFPFLSRQTFVVARKRGPRA